MNNLIIRTLTGVGFAASIIIPLFFNAYIAIAVFSVYLLLGIIEFYRLFSSNNSFNVNWQFNSGIALLIYGIIILSSIDYLPKISIVLTLPLLFLIIISEIWRKSKNAIQNSAIGVMGIVYLVVPFSLVANMSDQKVGDFPIILGMFLLIWSNDTFAYLTGRLIGKKKLIERISPNKTIEGTVGGIIFTLITGFLISFFTTGDDLLFWLISAIILAPCAIIGDLFESVIKRQLGVKDSGNILPGHGGILDRFDAMFLAVPFFFAWEVMYSYL